MDSYIYIPIILIALFILGVLLNKLGVKLDEDKNVFLDKYMIKNNKDLRQDSSIKLRRDNIKQIFVTTVNSMNEVVDKYDYCYTRLCNNSKNKNDFELHNRAFKLTLKLLE